MWSTTIKALKLILVAACADGITGVATGEPNVVVKQLERAVFVRIPGTTGDGACLPTGTRGSWNGRYVGSPTVVFADGKYRMWFVGGSTRCCVFWDSDAPR